MHTGTMRKSKLLEIEYTIGPNMSDQKKKEATKSNTPSSWIATKFRQLAQPGAAGPLIFACLCIALVYKNRNRKWEPRKEANRPPPRHVQQRSVSLATLHGGKVALQRMMDLQEARIDETNLEDAVESFRSLLSQEPYSFSKLQREAARLEMSGKEDEAVTMLQEAWEKADKAGQMHEAYELQMLLVEMLIYKGEFQQALECNCLDDKEISDARRPLYKAVLSVIKGNRTRAKKFYEEFQEIRSRFHSPGALREGSPLYGVVHDYETFERIVNNLKKEIDHAHKNKQA